MLTPYTAPTRFEQFETGAVIRHQQRRVVTETDNVLFARLSGHEHPSFFPYSALPADGPARVVPFLVLAICGGIAVRATSQAAIANLGWEYVRFPRPVFVGDRLGAITRIADKRLSQRDATRGVITIVTYGVRQGDEVVLEARRAFLVHAGTAAVDTGSQR